jgi:hypothetical protein
MSRHAHRTRPALGRAQRSGIVLGIVGVLVAASLTVSYALRGDPAPMSASTVTGTGPAPVADPPTPRVVTGDQPLKLRKAVVQRRAKAELRRKAERAARRAARRQPPTTFRVATFNVLGAAHTTRNGTHPGYASGTVRMRWAVSLLNSAAVTVAGLQEFEPPQFATFRNAAPAWGVFPGLALARPALSNSVVWRSDVWAYVEGHTISIPYFHGKARPMPYVLLRNVQTGQEVWFANFHNPANVRGPAARWRSIAVSREAALANSLGQDGTPVIMTGDMNDRTAFYCPMTARTALHAANGGSSGSGCRPPGDMGIDWILGSPDVTFEAHTRVRGGLVARTSDHPFVWAVATTGS